MVPGNVRVLFVAIRDIDWIGRYHRDKRFQSKAMRVLESHGNPRNLRE